MEETKAYDFKSRYGRVTRVDVEVFKDNECQEPTYAIRRFLPLFFVILRQSRYGVAGIRSKYLVSQLAKEIRSLYVRGIRYWDE